MPEPSIQKHNKKETMGFADLKKQKKNEAKPRIEMTDLNKNNKQ